MSARYFFYNEKVKNKKNVRQNEDMEGNSKAKAFRRKVTSTKE